MFKNGVLIKEWFVYFYLILDMFDYKFNEYLVDIYSCLDVEIIDIKDNLIIDISLNDDLIDLSLCIGIY